MIFLWFYKVCISPTWNNIYNSKNIFKIYDLCTKGSLSWIILKNDKKAVALSFTVNDVLRFSNCVNN